VKYGYARVSTGDQKLDLQVSRLLDAGCDTVIEEVFSGRKVEGRSKLMSLLSLAKKGDEIVCVKIDRLARSLRDVLNIVHGLADKGVALRVLEPEISTGGPVGNLVLTIFAMVGELELSIMKERQTVGIAQAKANGKYKGRPREIDRANVLALRQRGDGPTAIARSLAISRRSVYRVLGEHPQSRAGDSWLNDRL
jgi:DNA invertase Pin-like site-specific DNA recombinase